jgi:hypothetical protein
MSDEVVAFPVVGWEGIIGEQPFCLIRFGFIRTQEEGKAVGAGAPTPTVPLGFTVDQCRKLARDLLQAADAIETGARTN